MQPDQELELSLQLRAGQADAWRALYDAFAEPVWRLVARQMGPTSADVADVVQETFLAAARAAGSFDPARGRVWSWLCGIARRHVALHYRKQTRQARVRQAAGALRQSNGAGPDWLSGGEGPPGALLESAELATLVRAALTGLSDDYGRLLSSRYLEDVSVEQLADEEQSSPTAIRSKLARARAAFRAAFVALPDSSLLTSSDRE